MKCDRRWWMDGVLDREQNGYHRRYLRRTVDVTWPKALAMVAAAQFMASEGWKLKPRVFWYGAWPEDFAVQPSTKPSPRAV